VGPGGNAVGGGISVRRPECRRHRSFDARLQGHLLGGPKGLDLIPPDALVDRPALGIATTKLDSHGAEVSVAFQALFRFFRARGLPSLVVNDAELTVEETGVALTREAEDRLAVAVRGLQDAVARPASAAKT
jgi:NAD(P)H-dependent FMN reductase